MDTATEPTVMLREAGLRPTSARRRVLSSLLAAGRSLSHRELVELLDELDRVTIFRSLKNLKKARARCTACRASTELFATSPTRKESVAVPGGHPHFLCLKCRGMSCLTDQVMPVVRVPEGTEVRGKQFLVYGVCPSCASLARARTTPRSHRGGTK